MAEKSLFWFTDGFTGATGDGAAPYTQDEFSLYNHEVIGEGVVFCEGGLLEVTGTSTPLDLADGRAQVQGFSYWNSAASTLAVTTPSTGTTGGRVVLRADYSAATVRAVVLLNTDGNAGIPALTQTPNTTWEISLATFTVTTGGVITVTDARDFIGQTQKTQPISLTGSYNNTDATSPLVSSFFGLIMPDAKLSRIMAAFTIPADAITWLPMSLTAVFINPATATNNVVLNATIYTGTSGGAVTTTALLSSSVVAVPASPRMFTVSLGDISSLISSSTLATIQVSRAGADGSDNFAGDLEFLSLHLTYWAIP